jgi:restriction system protein
MSVPAFHELLLPILSHIRDGQPHRAVDTLEYVKTQFALSEEDLTERLPNGRTRLMDRVLWAITYLRKAGLSESISWGVFRITERGRALLAERPKSIGLKDLERYPEYLEFKGKGQKSDTQTPAFISQETPEESLEKLYDSVRSRLEEELLDSFKACNPVFFEKVVLKLLVALGYGGSFLDAASTTKRTGDDGIDGVIKEDRLGLDLIHVQAKRWKDAVGRPEVQNFAGSLEGQRGRKGVFITTSSFTPQAREYVSRIEKKIILIDGPELARLCVECGVGVLDQNAFVVKKLDTDFFNEE